MQLDKMKKADLIDLARKLKQELKLLKKTQETKESGDMPLVALSQVKHNGVDKIVRLKYNLETGKGEVVEQIDQIHKQMSDLNFDNLVIKYFTDQELKND